ncbi:RNA cap guanine-N2 methyltransferase-domain-containing protein [Bisporella sp. PMI_857]|nr:RNA cap guanine-N2 methyltransferase-domain-containing protein [Bisporella sp. PMI_857]
MGVSCFTKDEPKDYQCDSCDSTHPLHKDLLDIKAEGTELWKERRRIYDLCGQTPNFRVFPLTAKCHNYETLAEVDYDIQKYWHQRYDMFSFYDDGIQMTDDAWFEVTPEAVANQVASDLASKVSLSKTVIIDLFGGVGGNTIAFALSGRWEQVISIEKDASTIACAQHNAAIYGVANKINWIHGDCFEYMEGNSSSIDRSKTIVFASPPWGGPSYMSDEVFNLNTMQPYSLNKYSELCKGMDSAHYLPRTSNLNQIARLVPDGKKIDVRHYCAWGASKALVAYMVGLGS